MKTVVFHLQAKTCEKDISKLKEEILSYNIRIEEKELSEVKEEKDSILAITDQFSDVDYAKEHNIAVIFYETPGTNRSVSGVDMVVQGFEELNVEYLQLIYMRHHGLPWIIAKDGSDLHPRERGGGSYGFPEALPGRRDAGLSAESGV